MVFTNYLLYYPSFLFFVFKYGITFEIESGQKIELLMWKELNEELLHNFAMSSKYDMQLTQIQYKKSRLSEHTASETKTTKKKTNREDFCMMTLTMYTLSEYMQKNLYQQHTNCNVRINSIF